MHVQMQTKSTRRWTKFTYRGFASCLIAALACFYSIVLIELRIAASAYLKRRFRRFQLRRVVEDLAAERGDHLTDFQ